MSALGERLVVDELHASTLELLEAAVGDVPRRARRELRDVRSWTVVRDVVVAAFALAQPDGARVADRTVVPAIARAGRCRTGGELVAHVVDELRLLGVPPVEIRGFGPVWIARAHIHPGAVFVAALGTTF